MSRSIVVLGAGLLLALILACLALAAISPSASEAIEARSEAVEAEAEADLAEAEASRAESEAIEAEAEVEKAEAEADAEQAKADQDRAAGERAEAEADAYVSRELARAAARAIDRQGRLLVLLLTVKSARLFVYGMVVGATAIVLPLLVLAVRGGGEEDGKNG